MKIGIGTYIIAAKLQGDVVIAADSLRQWTEGKPETICKIVQVGRIFFAASGLNVTDTGFDIQEICRAAINRGGNIQESLDALSEMVIEPLKDALDDIKADDPDKYEALRQKSTVTVVFAGIENDEAVLSANRYYPRENVSPVEIYPSITDSIQEGQTVHLGVPSAAFELAKFYRRIPDPEEDLIAALRRAIQLEIDRDAVRPEEERMVGGPIRILRIGKDGVEWVQNEGCPDIEPF